MCINMVVSKQTRCMYVCMYALYTSTLTLKDGIFVGMGVGTLVDGLVVGTEDGL